MSVPPGDPVPRLDRGVFFILAALLAARPLISETYERLELSFLPSAADFGPSPAATVWLDAMMLVAAAIAFAVRGIDWPRLRWAWIGVALLAVAGVISTLAAGEKRTAANAVGTMLSISLAGLALLRLGRAPWMGRLLLAAILASAATNAVKCGQQRAYEFADTLETWRAQKQSAADQGAQLDDPAMVNYERRLLSGNTFGWLAHPNLTASILAMGGVVALGLLAAGIAAQRRSGPAWPIIAAAALLGGIVYALRTTGSNGAMLALLVGALTVAVALLLPGDSPLRRKLPTALLTLYAGLILSIAGYGIANGTLPGASLAFRWEYWTTAARSIGDAGATGLGRENFGAAYLLHKSPAATEEVQNPHSLWLSLLIEMGPIGLAAGALLMLVVIRSMGSIREARSTTSATGTGPSWLGAGLVAAGVLILQAFMSGIPLQPPYVAVAIVWLSEFAFVWAGLFALCWVMLRAISLPPESAGWLGAACLGAAFAAFVHNLIDFSLLTPAGMAMFVGVVCGGLLLEGRAAAIAGPRAPQRIAISAVAAGVIAVHLLAIAVPTTRANDTLESAIQRLRAARTPADVGMFHVLGMAATAADSLDSSVPRTCGQAMLQSALGSNTPANWRVHWLTQAGEFARQAQMRNPRSIANARLSARLADARAQTATPSSAAAKNAAMNAAEAWNRVVELYPTSPRDRIAAARAEVAVWRLEPFDETAIRAAEHIQKCLSIDNTRDAANAVKLRPRERAEIEELLAILASGRK